MGRDRGARVGRGERVAAAPHLAFLVLPALLGGCATVDTIWSPHLRADFALVDAYETEVEVVDFSSDSDDVEYQSVRVGLGAADVRHGRVVARYEVLLGRASIDDLPGADDQESYEFGAGGRWFVGLDRAGLRTFLSAYGLATNADTVLGVDPGTQLSVLAGAGLEYDVAERIALDLAVEYQFAFDEATSTPDALEFETSGFALRLGVVLTPW